MFSVSENFSLTPFFEDMKPLAIVLRRHSESLPRVKNTGTFSPSAGRPRNQQEVSKGGQREAITFYDQVNPLEWELVRQFSWVLTISPQEGFRELRRLVKQSIIQTREKKETNLLEELQNNITAFFHAKRSFPQGATQLLTRWEAIGLYAFTLLETVVLLYLERIYPQAGSGNIQYGDFFYQIFKAAILYGVMLSVLQLGFREIMKRLQKTNSEVSRKISLVLFEDRLLPDWQKMVGTIGLPEAVLLPELLGLISYLKEKLEISPWVVLSRFDRMYSSNERERMSRESNFFTTQITKMEEALRKEFPLGDDFNLKPFFKDMETLTAILFLYQQEKWPVLRNSMHSVTTAIPPETVWKASQQTVFYQAA